MAVRLQREAFDAGLELTRFAGGVSAAGAIVTFTGICRDRADDGRRLVAMTLEHYPEMAQAELETIEAEAHRRWSLEDALVVHRHGRLVPGDPIVLVATAARHRAEAFAAAEFIMDFLKTRAPFWKLEETEESAAWVAAKAADDAAAERW